jgi:hypothetical protein
MELSESKLDISATGTRMYVPDFGCIIRMEVFHQLIAECEFD